MPLQQQYPPSFVGQTKPRWLILVALAFMGAMMVAHKSQPLSTKTEIKTASDMLTAVGTGAMKAHGTRSVLSINEATDCSDPESPFKTNINCPAFEIYSELGGDLWEVTAKHFPSIKGYTSLAFQHLAPYCLRQLHWHPTNELAYVVSGGARVGLVGTNGITSYFTVSAGDTWFFPIGFLQYFQAGPEGAEIIFWFSDDDVSTLTIPQSIEPIPAEQFQKSFLVENENAEEFFSEWFLSGNGTACPATLPSWTIPPTNTCETESIYKFHTPCSNNSASIVDQFGNVLKEAVVDTFPVLENGGLSLAFAVIKPGCQRVLHWHPVPGELALVVQGRALIGLVGFIEGDGKVAPSSNFTVGPGDLWFFPTGFLQYITSIEPEGGEDFIAVLGFSADNNAAITATKSLRPNPQDINAVSLGVTNNTFFTLWNLTTAPFTCFNP